MSLDQASESKLLLLYPDFRVRVIRAINDVERVTGMPMRIQEGIRSFDTQEKYFQMGRTIPGPGATPQNPLGKIITNAKPGFSFHAYGIAVDCVFAGPDPYLDNLAATDKNKSEELWEQYARIGEAHGFFAGKRFHYVDMDHWEAHYGNLRVEDMLALFDGGGLKAVWSRFDKIRGVPEGSEWARSPAIRAQPEMQDILEQISDQKNLQIESVV